MELISLAAIDGGDAGGMLDELLTLNDTLHRALDEFAYAVKNGPRRAAAPATAPASKPITTSSGARPATAVRAALVPAPAALDDDDFFSAKCECVFV
jgi:hypothetical protein